MELIRTGERVELPDELPVVALRDLVFFPYMVLPLLIGRPASLAALEEAREGDGLLLLLAQRDTGVDDPEPSDLYPLGTIARAVQVTPLPDGTCRVVLEGIGRARAEHFARRGDHVRARLTPHPAPEADGSGLLSASEEALTRSVRRLFTDYCELHERVASELPDAILEGRDRTRTAHLMAGHVLLTPSEKQGLLESASTEELLEGLQRYLTRELEILHIEEKLDQQIRLQMDEDRRQLYLNEQLKAIHRELGAEQGEEWVELERAFEERPLPDAVRERGERELKRLRRLNPVAPEAAVIRSWLDWILALPWDTRSADAAEVSRAEAVLDAAHYGLGEVKERILDHIAVLSVVGRLQGPILCLVGPPGVGKTSLGRSIATALEREFVRVSLGGVRDEAEIRGHRRTYVGALPGRILQGMRRSGTVNPVFLLDEVDKLARDSHGDPGAALLEVLDPEQNATFTDHYLEVEYDLSDVLFLATANTLAGIPEALRDRMEVIRLPGYLETEKKVIARRFLWPRQAERHGLDRTLVELPDETVLDVVRDYTREAGVRELDRRISRIARKLAREGVERAEAEGGPAPGSLEVHRVAPAQLRSLLGPPPYLPPEPTSQWDRVGMANGLAWTAAGGELLDVEISVVPGSGEVRLTGTLGDVMKESAMAALTYARSRAGWLGLQERFHQDLDVHVHIPEGATPKDGPSAGITMATALVSALTGIPTSPDVALTGEITLRGRVLPVGGIKEKAVAALRHGIRTVILPAANRPELELLPDEVTAGVRFLPVRSMDEVLESALVRAPGARPPRGNPMPPAGESFPISPQ
jgi:ATP-dependent Lon protease